MEQHKGSIRLGDVSCSSGDGYISLELDDEASGIHFLEIQLTHEQFGRLAGTNGSVDCVYTVRGKENIGKTHEHKPGSISLSSKDYRALVKDVPYRDQQKVLEQWLLDNAKEEGWHVRPYLGSRDSIVGSAYGDGNVTLHFSYYRYVDQTKNESNG